MARSTFVTVVIAGVSGVAGALVVSSLREPSAGDGLAREEAAHTARRGPAAPLPEDEEARRRNGPRAPVVDAEKLLELERRLAALEALNAKDQRREGQEDRPSLPEPERRSSYDSRTPEARNEVSREQVARLRAQLAAEARDPAWSPDAERSIRAAFASLPATLGPPAALECGETFCGFELEYESFEAWKENSDHANLPAPLGGPSRTVLELIPGGQARLHVFLGRPGYSLPTPHAE